MATRFVKGKPRTETPRIKDLPFVKTVRDPSVGRGVGGLFTAGNPHAVGNGWKALIRRSLGSDSDNPVVVDLACNIMKLYRALIRSMPADTPGVRQLLASQARHAFLAAHYATEAAKAGLGTPLGLKLAEASRAHDKTAQGLSVAAYDRAVHEAQARPAAPVDIVALVKAGIR